MLTPSWRRCAQCFPDFVLHSTREKKVEIAKAMYPEIVHAGMPGCHRKVLGCYERQHWAGWFLLVAC